MRVRFLDGMAGSGERGVFYRRGDVVEIDDRLADSLIAKGSAVPLDTAVDPYQLMGEAHVVTTPENTEAPHKVTAEIRAPRHGRMVQKLVQKGRR